MYHFTDGGLPNVWLENGYAEKETAYGTAVSFDDLDGLTQAICRALAGKPGKLSGAEFRYLRSALLLSQNRLGKLLGCTEQAVAKWEKQGRVPKAEDCLLRLIFSQVHERDKQLRSVVEMLDSIDSPDESRIVLRKIQQEWVAKIAHSDNSRNAAEAA